MSPPPLHTHAASTLAPEQLLRLLEISARLNSTESPDQLLGFIIRTAAEMLACDAASLLLYDEETEQLHFAAATGADPDVLAQIPVPLDGSIAGTIFRENRTVRIENAEQDARHYSGVDEKVDFHTRSLIGVPMRVGDRVVGVLEALNKRAGDFSDDDELVLLMIADQAAVAIRAARQLHALRAAHDRMARMEAMKSRFLTLASHELRTPLTAVKGFTEIILEEAAPEVAGHAEIILEEVDTMDAVLDAMGEMSALRTGTDTFAPRPVSVDAVFDDARTSVAELIAEKGHVLTVEPGGDALLVRADAAKLATALANLLDNGVRFTPPGGTVTLRAHPSQGGVRIDVADTGRGLASEHLDAIFSDFFQVEDTLTRTHGGLGLGLTIARGIAEIHGGRLWAESDGLGRGATFCLWLPAPAALRRVPPPHASAALA